MNEKIKRIRKRKNPRNESIGIDDYSNDMEETDDNKSFSSTTPETISNNTSMIPERIIGKLDNQTIEIKIDYARQLRHKTLSGQIKLTAQYMIKSSYEVSFDL